MYSPDWAIVGAISDSVAYSSIGHPRRDADDQVGIERADLLEVQVGRWQHGRLGIAELVGRPRPRGERLVAVPVADADGHDTEREQGVLVGEADGDDPFGLLGDRRLAVLVLDGDGERHRRPSSVDSESLDAWRRAPPSRPAATPSRPASAPSSSSEPQAATRARCAAVIRAMVSRGLDHRRIMAVGRWTLQVAGRLPSHDHDRAAHGAHRAAGDAPGDSPASARRAGAVGVVVLVVVCLLSLAVGAKSIPLGTVIDAVFAYDPTNADHLIVR